MAAIVPSIRVKRWFRQLSPFEKCPQRGTRVDELIAAGSAISKQILHSKLALQIRIDPSFSIHFFRRKWKENNRDTSLRIQFSFSTFDSTLFLFEHPPLLLCWYSSNVGSWDQGVEIITCCNDEVQERWENVISNKRSNLGEVVDSFVAGTRFLTTNERHSHEKRPFRCSRLSRLSVFFRLSIRTRQWNGDRARPTSIRRFPRILSMERETCRN